MSTSSDQRAREEGPSRATALPPQQEEEEEAPPDQRELDLWLIESQVPRCTRDIAERAYARGHGDVSRALALARVMSTRVDFITFLRAGYNVLPTRDQTNPTPDPDPNDVESDDEPMPLMLAPESSSSEDEAPIAGHRMRLDPSISSRAKLLSIRRNEAKQNLRIIQEQLETEMSNAQKGVVMTEGSYLIMMNALKAIWPLTKPC